MRPQATPTSPSIHSDAPIARPASALDIVLRQARMLHRAAKDGPLSTAMPALRRAHAAGVFPGLTLPALYRQRQSLLQRKHFLRTLAVETGFPDWERFRPALQRMSPHDVDHLLVADHCFALLNDWFSTEDQAREFAREHGGRVLRVGRQAVVIAREMPARA